MQEAKFDETETWMSKWHRLDVTRQSFMSCLRWGTSPIRAHELGGGGRFGIAKKVEMDAAADVMVKVDENGLSIVCNCLRIG